VNGLDGLDGGGLPHEHLGLLILGNRDGDDDQDDRDTLPERYQKVVCLYYTKEMTMREIGEVMGVNESRVSQIHKTALKKMAVVLESEGIHSVGAF
jgi:DNA-directed RNA polymerase specialized sigma24 family protein